MARTSGYARSGRDYAQFDNHCDEHPKVAGLSDKLFRIWWRSILYCSRNLTDGLLPLGVVKERGWLKYATSLCAAGAWERHGIHFRVHDYLDWNDSKADVEARIERARAGGLARAQQQAQPQAEPLAKPDAQLESQHPLSTALLSSDSALEPQALGSVLGSLSLAEEPPQAAGERGEERAWWDTGNGLVDHDEQYLLGRLWSLGNWKSLRKSRYMQLRSEYGRPAVKVALQDAWDEHLAVQDPNAMLGPMVMAKVSA